MKILKSLIYLAVLASIPMLQANCPKCVRIRKYHEKHPEQNYEYYDDYEKDLKAGKAKSNSAEQDEGIAGSISHPKEEKPADKKEEPAKQ